LGHVDVGILYEKDIVMQVKHPTEKILPLLWLDAVFLLGGLGDLSSELNFVALKKVPNPLERIFKGFSLAISLPFALLAVLSGDIISSFGYFIVALLIALISFFLTAVLTYLYSRLLGSTERFLPHSFLLSLAYAPLSAISLLLTIFSELLAHTLNCILISQLILLIVMLLFTAQVIRYCHQFSLGRAWLAAGLTFATSLVIGFFIGLGLAIYNLISNVT
jgi:hypothetical protein